MSLKKFVILTESQGVSSESTILLNTNHIISIKPIRMTVSDQRIVEGYWIRMTNSKKYRATQVPMIIRDLLDTEILPKQFSDFDLSEDYVIQ